MNTIDTFEHAGLTIRIVGEEYVDESYDPRQWDQIGRMFCWHPDYELGDEQFTHNSHLDERQDEDGNTVIEFDTLENVAEFLRGVRKAEVILPLYLYDHSGISISVGNPANTFDPGGWDTSAVGFIYATRERFVELCGEWGYKPSDYEGTADEWLVEQLKGEVKEYDLYLTGDCGGYVIESEDDDHLDSCWGYLGLDSDHLIEDAKNAAEQCREVIDNEAREAAEWAARDVITTN